MAASDEEVEVTFRRSETLSKTMEQTRTLSAENAKAEGQPGGEFESSLAETITGALKEQFSEQIRMIAGSFEFQDMKLDDRLESLQAKFTERLNLLEERQSNAEKEFRGVLQALQERLERVEADVKTQLEKNTVKRPVVQPAGATPEFERIKQEPLTPDSLPRTLGQPKLLQKPVKYDGRTPWEPYFGAIQYCRSHELLG